MNDVIRMHRLEIRTRLTAAAAAPTSILVYGTDRTNALHQRFSTFSPRCLKGNASSFQRLTTAHIRNKNNCLQFIVVKIVFLITSDSTLKSTFSSNSYFEFWQSLKNTSFEGLS